MKKIFAPILLLGMIASLSACGKTEVTMQEIYNANLTEALLENHQSVYVQDQIDGVVVGEKYLTKEYIYDRFYDEDFEWMQFTTDDADYTYIDGEVVRYFFVTPDGVSNDFTSDRAERSVSAVCGKDTVDEVIESVSKNDGRISVTSVMGQKTLEEMAEYGTVSAAFEYELDVKTYEVISISSDYTYEDGTADHAVTEVTCDAEVPEQVKEFLEYANQTENLYNVTVVSNPGTEQEISQDFQVPKGLILGFACDDAFVDKVGFYTDAACTEVYDPYADTDSDLTVYVKWTE